MQKQKLIPKQLKELNDFITNNKTPGPAVRRAQAVLMLERNTPIDIAKQLTGFSKEHIFRLRRNYLKQGLSSFKDKREGDPKQVLTKKQRTEVITVLITKKPQELGYLGPGWTTRMMGNYIERKYKVRYKSRTSLYLIFKEAKFTYHKPERQYQKHDEKVVKKWRKQVQPKLKRAFSESNTVVLTEDEMVLSTQTTTQKVWLPSGEYPKIEVNQKRENRSLYGFLNLKTGQEHAWKTKRQNMYETVKILKKLRKLYSKKKILLLWDGAGWHRGSKAQEWIKEDGNIQTIYYPPYSPEENPQEHVWKEGRSQVTHNRFLEDIDQATNEFIRYLRKNKFNYTLPGLSGIS